jgi:hypothetical protein
MSDINEKYKDPFTLDGRVKVVQGVTEAKAAAAAELIERTMQGDRLAKGTLEEAMVSTDAVFNVAHVAQLNVLADFAEEERKWNQIATTRSVPDFRPATLYSIRPDWSAGGVLGDGEPRWVAPRVPEGTGYPYAYMEQEVSQDQGGIRKRGFKTGFTFEAFINDSIGFLQALPESMRQIALDTEEYEVFSALITGVGTGQDLAGGLIPDGTTTVVPNAPFSREALIRAIIELSEREINGRKVVVSGGYKLLIPTGQRLWVEYILNNVAISGYDSGSFNFTINGYNPLSDITVIESEFIPADSWYLMPNQNAARRPILELLTLVGHELPELRVQGNTGSYVGGGAVSPFEGSFDNDSADFRLRLFTKGQLWTPDLVVWSDGSGA